MAEEWFAYRNRIRYEVAKDLFTFNELGIEIGAGASPQRLPDGVKCVYADKRSVEELSVLFGTEITYDVQTMEDARKERPSGFDFLIAHNIVEHTANPIKFLIELYDTVRDDGLVIISVPDADHAPYDMDRVRASFEHVLTDFLFDRSEQDFESKEHIYSFIIAWSKEFPFTDLTSFIQHTIAEGFRDEGHDFHWHAMPGGTWRHLIGVSAMLADKKVEFVGGSHPQSEVNPTEGEVIFCYRISTGRDPASELNKEVAGLTRQLQAKLQKAAAQLDVFLDR